MTTLRTAAQQALEKVQEFKRRWLLVPAFGNKVNKTTREAITNAHSPIFELEHALRAALAEPVQEQRERELNEALTERDDADDYIDALLDEVLGPDRAEWSSAYGRADALEEVRERIAQMLKPSIDKAWNRFEAALEQQAEPVQEPAAYIHRQGRHWEVSERPLTDDEEARGWTEEPLYTALPKRKPLTDEELRLCFTDTNTTEPLSEGWPGLERFARALERAHGIGDA